MVIHISLKEVGEAREEIQAEEMSTTVLGEGILKDLGNLREQQVRRTFKETRGNSGAEEEAEEGEMGEKVTLGVPLLLPATQEGTGERDLPVHSS